MPIYAYKCGSCGFAKDVLQKISDPPLAVCPACGEATFGKQVTAAGFQLKGSGWYVTDFKGGRQAAAKKDGDGGKTDDKTETKPDAASDGRNGGSSNSEAKSDAKSAAGAAKTSGSASDAPGKPSGPAASPSSGDGG